MTEPDLTPDIIYAAKSTEDKHGSIPDQLVRTHAAAEAEGRQVIAEFSDEGFSAFKGNRGEGLAQARDLAEKEGASRKFGSQVLHLVLKRWPKTKVGQSAKSKIRKHGLE